MHLQGWLWQVCPGNINLDKQLLLLAIMRRALLQHKAALTDKNVSIDTLVSNRNDHLLCFGHLGA